MFTFESAVCEHVYICGDMDFLCTFSVTKDKCIFISFCCYLTNTNTLTTTRASRKWCGADENELEKKNSNYQQYAKRLTASIVPLKLKKSAIAELCTVSHWDWCASAALGRAWKEAKISWRAIFKFYHIPFGACEHQLISIEMQREVEKERKRESE